MKTYDSRAILIYLAVKFNGDPFKIINAICSKQDLELSPEEVDKVVGSINSNVITILDSNFPTCLKTMFRPPVVLFYHGDISLLNDDVRRYAVVGSREFSSYGKSATLKFVQEMGKDKVLVSGLSKGIDTIAQRHALDCGSKTIAVLGSGINNCYPSCNKDLYERIKKDGLIISEYPVLSAADKLNFPMSNRLIVALSSALIVPQVNSHVSGTIMCINYAVGANKPVYVVPHSIFDDVVNNDLIQEGANVAQNSKDILEELHWLDEPTQ